MKRLTLFFCLIGFFGTNLAGPSTLPPGTALVFAIADYDKHIVRSESCSVPVGINARNKAAILDAAIDGYAVEVRIAGDGAAFAAYFWGVTSPLHECGAIVSVLPHEYSQAIGVTIDNALALGNHPTWTGVCPALSEIQKTAYDRYIHAQAAKAIWDVVGTRC